MNKPRIKGNTIVVPSDPQFLSDVDMFVEGILRGWNTEESTIADIAISVSELVNNAITHGNQAIVDRTVTVVVEQVETQVAITVSDEGMGFDPRSIADPVSDENLLKDVGRGFFIVQSLMDEVEVDATDAGTTVKIFKNAN